MSAPEDDNNQSADGTTPEWLRDFISWRKGQPGGEDACRRSAQQPVAELVLGGGNAQSTVKFNIKVDADGTEHWTKCSAHP